MRIAISGTANTGKTTLVNDFLNKWPNFETTRGSYAQFLKEGQHSSKTTDDMQRNILNWMVDQLQENTPEDNIIYDRCPLDNLAYTLWGVHNETIKGSYADEIIPIVRESLTHLDIIFFVPFDQNIPIIDDGTREADEKYIKEIDAIFNMIYDDYVNVSDDTFLIFPKDNMPAVIPMIGSREQRLAQIGDYVDVTGDIVDTRPDESVLSSEQLALMEQLQATQEGMVREDKFKI